MALFHKKPKTKVENEAVDSYITKKLKKFPKKQREKLMLLYKDYKDGKLIFPEGFNKDSVLNKE